MHRSTEIDDEHPGVSLRPSDAVKAEALTLNDIWTYDPKECGGHEEDRLAITVPQFVFTALEQLLSLGGRRSSFNNITLWALARGLDRLEQLQDVQTIRAARMAILRSGNDGAAQLRWTFRVEHGGDSERVFLRYCYQNGRCAGLARALGLKTATLCVLALMVGLVDAPLPGDALPRMLELELQEFRRRLGQRALLAANLHKHAEASIPDKRARLSWSEIVNGKQS